ncbi:MAG: dienelactone hydrolase family protein [Salinibacter sp.]
MMRRPIRFWPLVILSLFVSALIAGCGGDGETSSEAERMAEEHEGDTPTATEAAQAPAIPVEGRTVSYGEGDGTELTGYLAEPANVDSVLSARDADALPGIVVIHEWWGLNDNIRAATRRLAGEGYRALAVDLYGDAVAESPDSAQALMGRAMEAPEQLVENVNTGRSYLASDADAPRTAVLGWCFGGGMTFRTLANDPVAYDAAVAYYGTPEPLQGEALQALETPVLSHFGTDDQAVSIEEARSFRDRAEEADAPVTVHEYEAGHAFSNPSGDRYDAEAAEEAWERTTEFLEMHLHDEGA